LRLCCFPFFQGSTLLASWTSLPVPRILVVRVHAPGGCRALLCLASAAATYAQRQRSKMPLLTAPANSPPKFAIEHVIVSGILLELLEGHLLDVFLVKDASPAVTLVRMAVEDGRAVGNAVRQNNECTLCGRSTGTAADAGSWACGASWRSSYCPPRKASSSASTRQ
jgi:hypothetical protein